MVLPASSTSKLPRAFARKGKSEQPYAKEQTLRWFRWLARGMLAHNQKVFLIEQLQPSWLTTRGQRRVYTISSRLIGFGLISGLTRGLVAAFWYGGLSTVTANGCRRFYGKKPY